MNAHNTKQSRRALSHFIALFPILVPLFRMWFNSHSKHISMYTQNTSIHFNINTQCREEPFTSHCFFFIWLLAFFSDSFCQVLFGAFVKKKEKKTATIKEEECLFYCSVHFVIQTARSFFLLSLILSLIVSTITRLKLVFFFLYFLILLC